MIFKPLKQLIFLDTDSNNLLFKVVCLDGRAKWKDLTNILSLKFQVSNEIETTELIKLEEGKLCFNFEITYFENTESVKKVRFSEFKVKRLELKSYTMSLDKEKLSFWRFFIEGNATNMEIVIPDK